MSRRQSFTIAHVSTQRSWYGGEEQAHLLARGLQSRGHRCVIYARRNGVFAERTRRDGFEVRTFSGNGRSPREVWKLHRELSRLRPDLVHFHDAHALTAGGLASCGLNYVRRIASRRCNYPLRSALKYRRLCDRVVAVSSNVAEVCVTSGIEPSHVRVVRDGVDPHRALAGDRRRGRAALRCRPGEIVLLTVASLSPSKGHMDLLAALGQVLASFPSVRLALAGEGKLRRRLEATARQLGVDHAVRFLGYRLDVPDLLQAADLFVMPSRVEPLGSSLIDAMLARVPIVATLTGGIPELVGQIDAQPGVALLAPPGDPAGLAEAIMAALSDPVLCCRICDEAERRARRLFTAERMVDHTIEVYRELLGHS
ncbi:MAG: glycosyltransferase [Planctomycetota bacterium]|jgi:glycosyltransferase involved in cell wall biosynthesis